MERLQPLAAPEVAIQHRASEELPRSPRPDRPVHVRSKSYLSSPVEYRPHNATTEPVSGSQISQKHAGKEDESLSSLFPRIHLPGHKNRHSQDFRDGVVRQNSARLPHRQHRHTQSEIHTPYRPRSYTNLREGESHINGDLNMADRLEVPGVKASMLTRMASNLSNRTGTNKPRHQYSNSDLQKIYALSRPDVLRRRATSDTRSPSQRYKALQESTAAIPTSFDPNKLATPQPQPPIKPLTEVERLLIRAEKKKKEADLKTTASDVQQLTTQLAESNVEIQSHLSGSTRAASDLMRRLDDAHETLLRTATSLTDTISSFHNLTTQSEALITNFGKTTLDLDESIKAQLEKSRVFLLEERNASIAALEGRGQAASKKAQALSQRLDNCRTILDNFKQRESKKRRAWRGVILGFLWGCGMILLGIALGLVLWCWRSYAGVIRYDVHEAVALMIDHSGQHNDPVQAKLLEVMKVQHEKNETRQEVLKNIPDDVKDLLNDIATRHGVDEAGHVSRAAGPKLQYSPVGRDNEVEIEEKKLKKLFDKLEL